MGDEYGLSIHGTGANGRMTCMRPLPTDGSAQQRLRWQLVLQLVRKDLKVKYQASALGFLWSLANPMLILIVYTLVFAVVFKSRVPLFGLFLMSGMLIWNFFTMGVNGATFSIVANAGLVKKVPFAHEALPLASVGFAGVQVALQYAVLIVGFFVVGRPPVRPELLLLIPALSIVLMAALGLGFFAAAATVRLRDTQHLIEVALFAWMWATPIIYPATLVHTYLGDGFAFWAYYLNPLAGPVVAFQRALYGVVYYPGTNDLLLPSADNVFYLKAMGISAIPATALLILGVWFFRKRSADFAEEL